MPEVASLKVFVGGLVPRSVSLLWAYPESKILAFISDVHVAPSWDTMSQLLLHVVLRVTEEW